MFYRSFLALFIGGVGFGCGQSLTRCDEGSVRFYDSSDPAAITQGLVEVCHNGTWLKVCFADESVARGYANVTCGQLGFSNTGASILHACTETLGKAL
jgi:hypothetical protein